MTPNQANPLDGHRPREASAPQLTDLSQLEAQAGLKSEGLPNEEREAESSA